MFRWGFLCCAVLRRRALEWSEPDWNQKFVRSLTSSQKVACATRWTWHTVQNDRSTMLAALPPSPLDEDEVIEALYPKTEPFNTGYLQVSDLHKIFFQEYGKKDGNPVIFLHGGPGAGVDDETEPFFFDPAVYHVVCFDQRGAGRSLPSAELEENTTWDLVEDIEKLRNHLGIDRWVVFGGSWGSTLSLAYAETHPDRVKAMVLRGIFTVRKSELEWLYEDRGGACMLFPDYFDTYRNFIPQGERKDILGAYYRRLTGKDEKVALEAAKTYTRWEMSTSRLYVDKKLLAQADDAKMALQFARIGCHYFVNGAFFESDTQLLDNVDKIRHIPATIIQGRYDSVCVAETAWLLHQRWPEATFRFVPAAGHSAMEPGIVSLLVKAADKYKNL